MDYRKLFKKMRDDGFKSKRIYFTQYELLKILVRPGKGICGGRYTRLRESLERLLGATIKTDVWWNNKDKCFKEKEFNIIDGYNITRDKDNPQSIFSYVDIGDAVWESIKDGYVQDIDLSLFLSFRFGITKRSFRILNKLFYDLKEVTFDLKEFAAYRIGFAQSYDLSRVRSKLRDPANELKSAGIISKMEFFKENRVSYVRFTRGSFYENKIKEDSPMAPISKEKNIKQKLINVVLKSYKECLDKVLSICLDDEKECLEDRISEIKEKNIGVSDLLNKE